MGAEPGNASFSPPRGILAPPRGILARLREEQRGDIITGWLFQLLMILAVIAFVAYELLAVVVTTVRLDDTAREVAREARDAYRSTGSVDRATDQAAAVAATHDAHVVAVEVDGEEVVVTVDRQAPTLVVHRIGALDGLTTATATSRAGRSP